MPRFLVEGRFYEPLGSHALYEAEYERLIEQWAPALFPGWRLVPFKIAVVSEASRRHHPDFALVANSYTSWCVVEVELGHHSLSGHVLPQVECFASGRYEQRHANYLCDKDPTLDPQAVRDLVKWVPPEVFVIVNEAKPSWAEALRRLDVRLGVVEVFRSTHNQHALRLNGEQPLPPIAAATPCIRDPLLWRSVVVVSPGILGVTNGETITISVAGVGSEWVRVDAFDRVYLSPKRGNPLRDLTPRTLLRTDDDRWVFDTE